MAIRSVRHAAIAPTHPGVLLGEVVIPATGRSKTEIARLLLVSRQTLYDVIAARQPVTPSMAVRLGKLFGNGAMLWIRMQAAHDVWRAERDVDTSEIPTLSAAVQA
jgi:addiction module HigA family antidote